MTARHSLSHAPRWLREHLDGGARAYRHMLPDARSVHGPSLLPVLLVIALAIGADLAEVVDVGLHHSPLGLRMQTGLDFPAQRALSVRAAEADSDDALLSALVADVPPASVDALIL
jgi:hypothetical protein